MQRYTEHDTVLYLGVPIALVLSMMAVILLFGLNQELFLFLNHWGQILPDTFWAYVTTLGDALLAPVLLFIVLRNHPRALQALLIAAVFAFALTHILKPLFDMPRPAAVLDPNTFHIIGQQLTHFSFPSGHTITAFTAVGLAAFFFMNPRLIAIAFMMGALIGLSRVMVGAHWPADVLAGAAGGWLCAWLGVSLASKSEWSQRLGNKVILLLFFILLSVIALFYKTPYQDAQILVWGVAELGFFLAGLRLIYLL